MAVSVSLPIAWISLGKGLLLLVGLGYLLASAIPGKRYVNFSVPQSLTSKIALIPLVLFFISLLWTDVHMEIALLALVKHAKLLVILLLPCFIRTPREAYIGAMAFVAGQLFLLFSSWLLAAGIPIFWALDATGYSVVYSSYLDQSIMFATTAAVLWHLKRGEPWQRWMTGTLAAATLASAILLLDGRTGYVIAIAMVSLAVMWTVPKKLRIATLLVTPVLVLAVLLLGSSHVQGRITKIFHESQSYSQQVETESSSGWRLNAWQRSIQAIQENPWYGHGVGSWAITVKRIQGASATQTFGEGNASNPHQEYLLWGVEIGLAGTALLIFLFAAMAWDARHFPPSVQRATWSVLTALAVAGLFNSVLYDDLIGDYFCVALGLLMALGFQNSSKVPPA